MRTRHRVPTIFNLSMVDVLCCALGCVILLWLLNQRAAREQTVAAEQTGLQLNQSQLSLDSAERELKGVRQSLSTSQERERQLAAQVQRQRLHADQLGQQLAAASCCPSWSACRRWRCTWAASWRSRSWLVDNDWRTPFSSRSAESRDS